MNIKLGRFSAALLNLTGVGLGYFLVKRYLRGVFHLVGTIALFTVASLTRAAYSPRIWLIILGTWWLWMFIDGWLQAHKYMRVTSSTVLAPSPVFKVLARAIAVAEILGIISFQLAGFLDFNAGVKAFESLEFSKAQQYFKRVDQYYQLTLNPNVIAAERYLGEAALLIDAEEHRQLGQYEGSINAYEKHLSIYPSSSVTDFVRQQTIEIFLAWSSQLHETGDFESSIKKYEIVSKKYGANVDKEAIAEKVVSVYFDWAEALRRERKFEDAFQKYDTVQKNHPESSGISQIKTFRAGTYTEWISDLRSNHEYTKAIDHCRAFSNEYPYLQNAEDLRKEISSIYREGAEYERRTARFDSAIDKYIKLINDYADTEAAEGIDEMTIAQTYLECGDYLQGQKKYINAMDCYSNVKETTKDKEINKTAQTGYDSTLKNLSLDTNTDGDLIISQTKSLACNGNPAASPAVNLEKNEPGKALSCDGKISLPDDLEPMDPGHFRYVIKVETGIDRIQSCPYSIVDSPNSNILYYIFREVRWEKVSIYHTTTGRLRIEKKFSGDRPAVCPQNTYFSVSEDTMHYTGTEPDSNTIIEWIKQVIK